MNFVEDVELAERAGCVVDEMLADAVPWTLCDPVLPIIHPIFNFAV
jgi:hypothetical protein